MTDGMQRTLVLMRHAKSAWPDVPDQDRPLARRGERDAPAMGRWLRAVGRVPDYVLCSPAQRAVQTWRLAQTRLGTDPSATFDERIYGGSAEQLAELLRQVPPGVRTVLLVGHDPAIPELALMLSGDGGDAGARERLAVKFPTGAVAILEFDGGWDVLDRGVARLTSFVIPKDLG